MNMSRKGFFVALAAGFVLLGCVDETRKGQLVLSGPAPVRIVDESGKTVEFVTGPVKVEFSANSGRKFIVALEQGNNKKARFSGRAPGNGGDWNFILRGREIGQPVDLSSRRRLEFYGASWTRHGDGGSCGGDGRWVTEEKYQKCNEDWRVAFTDAQTSQAVGDFSSRRDAQDCLLSSRNLWCHEQPRHEPPFPRDPYRPHAKAEGVVKSLSTQVGDGVTFD